MVRLGPGWGLTGITALFEGVRAAQTAWDRGKAPMPACPWGSGAGLDEHDHPPSAGNEDLPVLERVWGVKEGMEDVEAMDENDET